MAVRVQGHQFFLEPRSRWGSPFVWIPLVPLVMSLLIPVFGQAPSFSSEEDLDLVIDGNTVNTPNRNSSSGVPNMPFVEIPTDTLVRIGHVCEHDSNCGNFSLCTLKKLDEDTAIKICDCDQKEMKRVNQFCYILPGHQCYFPDKNSHGYRLLECLPGSVCRKSVNRTMPDNGYCMCEEEEGGKLRARDLNMEFEMTHCAATSLFSVFSTSGSVILSMILVSSSYLWNL